MVRRIYGPVVVVLGNPRTVTKVLSVVVVASVDKSAVVSVCTSEVVSVGTSEVVLVCRSKAAVCVFCLVFSSPRSAHHAWC